MISPPRKKITWLLLLQGWTMLWVVIGHAPLSIADFSATFDASCHEYAIFGSFRNYTYQIFLLGIFIQIGIKIIYDKLGIQGTYPYFYILCVLSGIYIPVLISKVIQRIGNKYLNMLIGL